jgi:hypothetical protein
VRVHGQLGAVEREEQDARGRLPSNPRQGLEELDRLLPWGALEEAQVERSDLGAYEPQDLLDPLGLYA